MMMIISVHLIEVILGQQWVWCLNHFTATPQHVQ